MTESPLRNDFPSDVIERDVLTECQYLNGATQKETNQNLGAATFRAVLFYNLQKCKKCKNMHDCSSRSFLCQGCLTNGKSERVSVASFSRVPSLHLCVVIARTYSYCIPQHLLQVWLLMPTASILLQGNKAAKPAKPAASDLPVPAEGVRNIKSMWEKGNVFSSPGGTGTPNKVRI